MILSSLDQMNVFVGGGFVGVHLLVYLFVLGIKPGMFSH